MILNVASRIIERGMQIVFAFFWLFVNVPGEEMKRFTNGNSYSRKILCRNASKAIRKNAKYSAGKITRFITYDSELTITVKYKKKALLNNMDDSAVSSIDVFSVNEDHYSLCGSVKPSNSWSMVGKKTISFGDESSGRSKELALFLPGYSAICELRVYSNSELLFCNKKRNIIAVYGSSISQGCAASTTSMSYINLVAIENDMDVVNFAFSEGAKGEDEVISELAASNAYCYIIEYDHNSNVEGLEKTHRKIYKTIREKTNNSIIILLTRLSGGISISREESYQRERIIKSTYDYGKERGDNKLFLINNYSLSEESKRKLLRDDRHPNDSGMRYLADRINEVLEGTVDVYE